MGAFFINSSEILTLAMLNNKAFYFNQKEMANAIGCRQPNISYVINNLIEKGIVGNAKGFIMVNQYRLVDCLVAYADAVYNSNVYFQENVLKLRNWDPEIYAFFETYLRIFNIEYVITECKSLNEICFVFKSDFIDIADVL